MCYGSGEKEAKPDKFDALGHACIQQDLLRVIVGCFKQLPFEARKDLAAVFSFLASHDIAGFTSTYLVRNIPTVSRLLDLYEDSSIALVAGLMARDAMKASAAVHTALLTSRPHSEACPGISDSVVQLMTRWAQASDFDVAADAMTTINCLLTCNKAAVKAVLLDTHLVFFDAYSHLLLSESFPTQRQSLELLSEILLDRDYFDVMLQFVKSTERLKNVMICLRDPRPTVQFEAFHVFKVFVANPEKPPAIVAILYHNREKLIKFLQGFQPQRDDDQLVQEKALLIQTLKDLPAPSAASPAAPAAAAAASAAAPAGAGVAAPAAGTGKAAASK